MDTKHDDKGTVVKRHEEWGWAIFLVMTGVIWLMPANQVPQGAWLIGTGLILLALNALRYLHGMPMSAFTSLLGALALAGGLSEFFGAQFPLLAVALILLGVSIVIKQFLGGRK